MRDGFMLFAFVMEDFQAQARANKGLFPKLGMLLIAQQDALRGMIGGHVNLAPVSLAASVRIALEARINFTYIVSSSFPYDNADLFVRYADLQRLAHDEDKPPEERQLKAAERQRLIELCGEWITTKKSGSLRFHYHWWAANPDLERASLRDIARAAGLAKPYEQIYSVTSAFVHGSPLMKYGFEDESGRVAPIGIALKCKQIAVLGFAYTLRCLQSACQFFGVPIDSVALALWQSQLVDAARDALPNDFQLESTLTPPHSEPRPASA